ncbi:MAG: TauD/TfdA dioxygenase family protein [Acidimicrobiales bacterium]
MSDSASQSASSGALPTGWAVTPIAAALGVRVEGPDVSREQTEEEWAALDRLYTDHLVLVISDQTMNAAQHVRFASHFGEPYIHPFLEAVPESPAILQVLKEPHEVDTFGGEHWHCDISFESPPAATSVLYGIEIPPLGGDTMFANQYHAFDRLSEGFQRMVGELSAHHTYPGMQETDEGADALHPMVRVHPVSGRRALYVNAAFVSRIEGLTHEESAPILRQLFTHQVRPEFQARVTWRPGQVVVWDNRATLHHAMNDYSGVRRRLERVTAMERQVSSG